jgi:hypothetical protein
MESMYFWETEVNGKEENRPQRRELINSRKVEVAKEKNSLEM